MTTGSTYSKMNKEDAFGAAVAKCLSQSAQALPHDVSERLKAARMQALAKRKVMKIELAQELAVAGGAATLSGGRGFTSAWSAFASLIPLVALVVGLITIALLQDDNRARELAGVDLELLTDELPPAAYTDPGFAQYLRSERGD